MSTTVRPEVSKKKEHWIPKHRYYELKHFVMQRPDFVKGYVNAFHGYPKSCTYDYIFKSEIPDPTYQSMERAYYFRNKIDLIDNMANEADPIIGPIIIENIVNGKSWNESADIPCSRAAYYDIYRKFFWLLSREMA